MTYEKDATERLEEIRTRAIDANLNPAEAHEARLLIRCAERAIASGHIAGAHDYMDQLDAGLPAAGRRTA
jgi:hypothetical protein